MHLPQVQPQLQWLQMDMFLQIYQSWMALRKEAAEPSLAPYGRIHSQNDLEEWWVVGCDEQVDEWVQIMVVQDG